MYSTERVMMMKAKFVLCSLFIVGCLSACSSGTKNLLENPKDVDVKTAIENLEGMKSICMVTEDNDPNGMLNKDGGYTGALYFRLTQVDDAVAKDDYPVSIDDDACEAGTRGGGQIEIYANENDATKRNDYLSSFDGTVLSDSHTVKGTVIIRLSNELTASQQTSLETSIIEILSKDIE